MRNLFPQKIQKSILHILSISLVFLLLRIPSLYEPYWYGDEGIYEVIGKAIRSGRILYTGIWDNKPPLLYIIYALFDSDQFFVRAASVILGTLFFAILFGLPLLEGNIANAENFMLFPILLSALLIYSVATKNDSNSIKSYSGTDKKMLFVAGLMLGVAFLFKIVAVFDFSALVLFFIITTTPSITSKKISHISAILKS